MAENTEDKMNVLQLLVSIVDRPAATMSYVGKKPGWAWVMPALLVLVGLVAFSVVTAPLTSELTLRQALTEYCALDTLAMVRLAGHLELGSG